MATQIMSARVSSTTMSTKRSRRRRPTVFSESHLERLEAEFAIDRYPDIDARERLAASLGLGEDRIQVSFERIRIKAMMVKIDIDMMKRKNMIIKHVLMSL